MSVDSTMIPTYVNKFRLDNDSEALFGYSWTKGWVYGYKDHSLVDISSDLPIDFVVTTANIHDSKALIPLLKQTNINNNNTSELYGDKAYCYKSERDFVTKKIKIDYVVSFRRNMQIYKLSQNQKTLIEYFQWKEARIIPSNSVEGKKKYPLKQSVERHFSHEKTFFNIDNPQFRGKESIAITITLAKISILLFALAMVKLGFPEHIRKYSILKTC
ncbi:MAG: transposase [Candidatus Nanoarchaeia archaeon]